MVFFVLKFSLNSAGVVWKRINPPKPAPPTVAFGKLPPISFPKNEDLPSLNFKLETIQGKLPSLDNIAKAYFISKNIYTYLTYERALQKARSMGFNNEPIKQPEISGTTYFWQDKATIPSTLTMEIINQNFHFQYDFAKDQSLLTAKNLITNDRALEEVKTFLRQTGFLPDDIARGESKFTYFRYSLPDLVEVASLSETDFIRVSLMRQKINELEVLSSNPYEANISALVSKSGAHRIVDLKYTHFPIDPQFWGTYPLKDTTQAWDDLKNGRGYIANLGDNRSGDITIRKVYLAYYDPHIHQNYLQPIFVFEGDKKFFAYVPAITNQWIEKSD